MTRRDATGLPYVVTAEESRGLDAAAIERLGMPGRLLMEVAGQGAARAILARTGAKPANATVLCGPGNNGGDGYVVARLLRDAGWRVRCLSAVEASRLSGDALANCELFKAVGGSVQEMAHVRGVSMAETLASSDVVVDALFGTGLSRPLPQALMPWIQAANGHQGAYRVSLDVPSGVCATKGTLWGEAFRADLTVTFGLIKSGLLQFPAAAQCGEICRVPIGLPTSLIEKAGLTLRGLDGPSIAQRLPSRSPESHKGRHGRMAVVGGFGELAGAAVLTGVAALRAGAGYATWYSGEAPGNVARPPELLAGDWPDLQGVDSLVLGPGLGTSEEASRAMDHALSAQSASVVLDADALNHLASSKAPRWPDGGVVTPHPGEAARLLSSTTEAVQADRLGALKSLIELTQCVVVLKGAATLIGAPGHPSVVAPGGAPTLAAAGSGDVLAGLIGGLMAQGVAPFDASLCAVWLHVTAAQTLGVTRAERGVLASEVAAAVPEVIQGLRMGWGA